MGVIDLYREYFELFGIDKYVMRLSTHHRQRAGQEVCGQRAAVAQDGRDGAQAMDNGGVPYVEVRGRGRLLRPQDRRADLERHRPGVLAGHEPGGLCRAAPL